MMGSLFHCGWLALVAFVTPAESVFQSAVRPTDPLPPAAQLQTFHLPPEFTITCFAAEPDLQKPMNMAFDGRGRLWVSGSVEYPHAAAEGQGSDTIRILEDTDNDGRADKMTVFADGLNIPMGLYPYRNGVIVYSQPHIWFLQDTDGDDRADRRDILYHDLGTPRDTHGMQNAFRRGFDGWIYVCHGYANHSVVRGSDGSTIELTSGNTYRIRPDGTRVEHYTHGQVNPFGMAFLPNGDLITADCHSKPLTLLLRGGCYPSFGRPHDGLGFVPSLMEHSHGSTAISGVAIPTGDSFPSLYRNSLLVGNVMTSRVHHDTLQYHGATAQAVEQPDLLACDDPWFRPVDLQFGPDGALYVADFYNKIIGHYEVDLNHPERDRHRGRIWRIAPKKNATATTTATADRTPIQNLTRATADELITELASDNLTRRMLATDQLTDRLAQTAIPHLKHALANTTSAWVRIHASWALFRLQALELQHVTDAAQSSDPIVRVHAMRMLAEWPTASDATRRLILAGMHDSDPHVRRLAAEAAGLQPGATLVGPLVELLEETPSTDMYLSQTVRIALRNQMRDAPKLAVAQLRQLPMDAQRAVADIGVTIPDEAMADFLLGVIQHSPGGDIPQSLTVACLTHAAEHLPIERTSEWVELIGHRMADNLALQFQILDHIRSRHAVARRDLPPAAQRWARQLVEQVYPWPAANQWVCVSGDNPWSLEPRQSSGADGEMAFLSSLPGGEQKVSTLRSPVFQLPNELSFYVCGHRGFPQDAPLDGNRVRLCLADGGKLIREVFPPRNDVATKVTWELAEYVGESAYLELIDGIDLDAYAWLAVAQFSPPVVTLPNTPVPHQTELTIHSLRTIEQLRLLEYVPQLRKTLAQAAVDPSVSLEVAAAAAHSLTTLVPQSDIAKALASLLDQQQVAAPIRRQWCASLAAEEAELQKVLAEAISLLDFAAQRHVADQLASTRAMAEILAEWMKEGRVSPQLLHTQSLWQKLLAAGDDQLRHQFEQLRQSAPSPQVEVMERVARIVHLARSSDLPAGQGQAIFEKNCAACHKVGTKGNMVGPQLDGIGSRGAMRIAEDVLLPNRNVDQTFRVSVLALKDGRVITGLKHREEDTRWILVNDQGQEFAVDEAEIEEVHVSNTSLMPDGFATTLSDSDLAALIAYLASLTES